MEVSSRKDLITIIDRSAEELHQRIEMHRYLMATILKQRVSDRSIKGASLKFASPHETKLREALKETIEGLEKSRKAFKSKKLEALRKKLTQVLIETR